MGFKEQAEKDLARIFLNEMEFAEVRQIDGVPLRVIVDDHSLVERGSAEHTDGIYSAQILLFIAAADYGARPKRNKLLNLDGRDYRIVKVEGDLGLYTFTLEANRA